MPVYKKPILYDTNEFCAHLSALLHCQYLFDNNTTKVIWEGIVRSYAVKKCENNGDGVPFLIKSQDSTQH